MQDKLEETKPSVLELDKHANKTELAQSMVSHYLKLIEGKDLTDLTAWTEVQQDLRDKYGDKFRSTVSTLTRLKVYVPKPKVMKKDPLERYEEDNLTASFGHATLILNEKIQHLSKDRILSELETRLKLPQSALYSLRNANRLSLVALILAVKDVENGILEPSLEDFLEEEYR